MMRKMARKIFVFVSLFAISLLVNSCSNTSGKTGKQAIAETNKVQQLEDGTINLKIEKAFCYNNESNPAFNAAEWNLVVSKSGLYNVWLSSATIDTLDLQYTSNVTLNLQDKQLTVKPVKNKIILNASGVKFPYFRADSYLGELYIQEPGDYTVTLISEKVIARSDTVTISKVVDHTKVISVYLTPKTQ
jgi:hypothetical protein